MHENAPMSIFHEKKHIPILVQDALSELGRSLALRRKSFHLTQPELALQAGVGLSTLVSIEKGHDGVSVGNLCKVLDVLRLLDQIALIATDTKDHQ